MSAAYALSDRGLSCCSMAADKRFFIKKTARYLFFICFGAILNVPVIFMLQGFVGLKQP